MFVYLWVGGLSWEGGATYLQVNGGVLTLMMRVNVREDHVRSAVRVQCLSQRDTPFIIALLDIDY